MLLFTGRYRPTLDSGFKGIWSCFETSDQRNQVIAINQLVDIKPVLLRRVLRSQIKNVWSQLSGQSTQPHLGVGVIFFPSLFASLWTSFSDYLSLLKSKSVCLCSRSAGVTLWSSCASLWFVVSFMVWIELDFTSALTRWHWMLSPFPHWP